MHDVRGVVQHYAWGHPTAIPELLGATPDGQPWAELWFGTHPGGPALLGDGSPLLDESGRLPYLLKVLAAAEPLSLQTHPDAATAREGYAREDAAGIPSDSPGRIYRDSYAKPEILIALTPFDALCGFRPVDATIDLLGRLGAGTDALASQLASQGLTATVAALYRGDVDIRPVVDACREAAGSSREAALVARLAHTYPGDASVVVTLLLHRVLLGPGEALYLTPGNLHAYLDGVGVEVMGASDNVVRGGITPKHVDVDELLRVLSYDEVDEPVVHAVTQSPGVHWYPTPGAPFAVLRFDIVNDNDIDNGTSNGTAVTYTAEGRDLLLCTSGDAGTLHRGECAYLAPGEAAVLRGPSTVWAVTAP